MTEYKDDLLRQIHRFVSFIEREKMSYKYNCYYVDEEDIGKHQINIFDGEYEIFSGNIGQCNAFMSGFYAAKRKEICRG